MKTTEQTSDNIITENPNHRLTILAIKQINSSTCILGKCVNIRVGKSGGNTVTDNSTYNESSGPGPVRAK